MQRIPLKQYMDSKRQLIGAIDRTPITTIEYEIRKYCTISLGESVDDSTIVALKPRQKIVIEWIYNDPQHPSPTKLSVVDKDTDISEDHQSVYWTADKINKWLSRYAKDGRNKGHTL